MWDRIVSKNKTYRTVGGDDVVIYDIVDEINGNEYVVHGRVGGVSESWLVNGHYSTGGPCKYDLVEVLPRIRHTYWVNVYVDSVIGMYQEKSVADRLASAGRQACVKITIDCEQGAGL